MCGGGYVHKTHVHVMQILLSTHNTFFIYIFVYRQIIMCLESAWMCVCVCVFVSVYISLDLDVLRVRHWLYNVILILMLYDGSSCVFVFFQRHLKR